MSQRLKLRMFCRFVQFHVAGVAAGFWYVWFLCHNYTECSSIWFVLVHNLFMYCTVKHCLLLGTSAAQLVVEHLIQLLSGKTSKKVPLLQRDLYS